MGKLEGHQSGINCLQFDSETGRLYSKDDDGILMLWDLNSNPIIENPSSSIPLILPGTESTQFSKIHYNNTKNLLFILIKDKLSVWKIIYYKEEKTSKNRLKKKLSKIHDESLISFDNVLDFKMDDLSEVLIIKTIDKFKIMKIKNNSNFFLLILDNNKNHSPININNNSEYYSYNISERLDKNSINSSDLKNQFCLNLDFDLINCVDIKEDLTCWDIFSNTCEIIYYKEDGTLGLISL